jgi:hypothetical protein
MVAEMTFVVKFLMRLVIFPGQDKHSWGPEQVLHEAWQRTQLLFAFER